MRFQKRASLIVNEERQIYATFGKAEFHQSHERKRLRHRLTSSPITKMACGVAFHGEEKMTATSTGCSMTFSLILIATTTVKYFVNKQGANMKSFDFIVLYHFDMDKQWGCEDR